MKTNQFLTHKMGDFNVNQRTSDGMFNATELLKQWNNGQGNKRGKEVNDFLKIDKTKEFISALDLDYNAATKKIVVVKNGGNCRVVSVILYFHKLIDNVL
jgi:hypothetical protein